MPTPLKVATLTNLKARSAFARLSRLVERVIPWSGRLWIRLPCGVCKGVVRLLTEQGTMWSVDANRESLAVELAEIFKRHGYDLSTTRAWHPVHGQFPEAYVVAQPRVV